MKSHRKTPRSALTALELLVAATLSALLMVSFLGLLAHLSQRHQELTGNAPDIAWHGAFADRLESDFAHAHTIYIHPRVLILDGFVTRNINGSPLHVPGRIVYRIESIGQRSLLVREQQTQNASETALVQSNLVASGLSEFSVVSFRQPERVWRRESWQPDNYKRITIEGPIRVQLWRGDQDNLELAFERVMVRTGGQG